MGKDRLARSRWTADNGNRACWQASAKDFVQIADARLHAADRGFLHNVFSSLFLLRASFAVTLESSECNAGVSTSAVRFPTTVKNSTSTNRTASCNSRFLMEPARPRNSAKAIPSASSLSEPSAGY